jgi:beta-N-acetylhexosaminidase
MKRLLVLVAIALVAIVAGGTSRPGIDRTIDSMSADERIAQLLFFGFSGQVADDELRELAAERHVGGIALYAHNIESREQIRRLNDSIVRLSAGHPVPFIAVDQEGGIVHRLNLGVPVIPSAMALGATRSPDLARRLGVAVGASLRDLGFTMNFAPVLDVLTEPRNEAIGTRAFSDDPELTATLGSAFIEGQQSTGMIAVAKHFPGQGGVVGDTHTVLPRLDVSLARLWNRELVPFRRAFGHGLGAVMTSHIALPQIAERPDRPATLSPRVMTVLLRKDLHFDGILITDALQMDALSRARGAGALALEAILAGSDMVLTLGDAKQRREVFSTLVEAYRDGRLPKRRVREALRRILAAKAALPGWTPDRTSSNDAIAAEIARRAATVVDGSAPLVPLPPELREHLVYVGPDGLLESALDSKVVIALPAKLDDITRDRLRKSAHAAVENALLFVAAAANEQQFAFIRDLHNERPAVPFVFVNLGSPFRVVTGSKAATVLMYAEDDASQNAAAEVLRGDRPATGTSPVALPNGSGAKKTKNRIRVTKDRFRILAVPVADERRVDGAEIDARRDVARVKAA